MFVGRVRAIVFEWSGQSRRGWEQKKTSLEKTNPQCAHLLVLVDAYTALRYPSRAAIAIAAEGLPQMWNMSSNLFLALILFSVPAAHSQCYLMDADAKCAVCWKTIYGDADDKVGVTMMSECPDAIVETWDAPLPEKMLALQEYEVTYTIRVDPSTFEVDKQGDNHVPHANIHSCVASRGACTPFVANTPGLATRTSASKGNFTNGVITFDSNVKLPKVE